MNLTKRLYGLELDLLIQMVLLYWFPMKYMVLQIQMVVVNLFRQYLYECQVLYQPELNPCL